MIHSIKCLLRSKNTAPTTLPLSKASLINSVRKQFAISVEYLKKMPKTILFRVK